MLQSSDDHPQIARRFEIVRSLLEQKGIIVEVIRAAENDRLLSIFSLIQLGDWVSYYAAMLNDVDPTEIKAIDQLKKELGRQDR